MLRKKRGKQSKSTTGLTERVVNVIFRTLLLIRFREGKLNKGSRFARVVPNSRGSIVKITCHPPCGKQCGCLSEDRGDDSETKDRPPGNEEVRP